LIPWSDISVRRRPPIVNTLLILINVFVFIVFELPYIVNGQMLLLDEFVKQYGLVPYFVLNGMREYTLFTHMWIHGSIEHIVGNMLFLWIFGDNVESVLGHKKYLLFYLISGLGAVVFHLLSITLMTNTILSPYIRQNPWLTPAIGASGAISGVLGAYMLFFPGALVEVMVFVPFPFIFTLPAWLFIGFWFIQQLIMGMYSLTGVPTGVAWWAHVGGFLTGMALAYLMASRKEILLHRREAMMRIPMWRVF